MNLTTNVAHQFGRLHWRIGKTPYIGQLYTGAIRGFNDLRDASSYLAWKFTKSPPRLGRRFAQRVLNNETTSAVSPSALRDAPIEGRLAVRIAFHFKKSRLKYLVEMLEQIKVLPFRKIVIAIDTNTRETEAALREAGIDYVDEIAIHNLENPYRLTWVHRDRMKSVLDDFDYFMYAEDDLLITPESIRVWHSGLSNLAGTDYLPSFLRVELNRSDKLVSSDFMSKVGRDRIVVIGGKSYLHTPFPYQAFWIYDKKTMLEFVETDVYRNGQPGFDVRESVAYGCTYRKTADGWKSRYLLPLDGSGQIDPQCFIYHMPSNYGRLLVPNGAGLGTFPVANLVDHA